MNISMAMPYLIEIIETEETEDRFLMMVSECFIGWNKDTMVMLLLFAYLLLAWGG